VFRETHQSSHSRDKIGQGKVYYQDTEGITELYLCPRMTDSPRDLSRPGAAPKCQQWQTLDPLFGSMLSEAERLGDVDIAIELLPKVAEAEFRKWCDMRRYAARAGKSFISSLTGSAGPGSRFVKGFGDGGVLSACTEFMTLPRWWMCVTAFCAAIPSGSRYRFPPVNHPKASKTAA
jgi:hypothetical protein